MGRPKGAKNKSKRIKRILSAAGRQKISASAHKNKPWLKAHLMGPKSKSRANNAVGPRWTAVDDQVILEAFRGGGSTLRDVKHNLQSALPGRTWGAITQRTGRLVREDVGLGMVKNSYGKQFFQYAPHVQPTQPINGATVGATS